MASPTSATPAKYLSDNELDDLEPVSARAITGLSSSSNSVAWTTTEVKWDNDGTLRNEILYSLYGYIRVDQGGNIVITNNGAVQRFDVNPNNAQNNISRLPAVRYLLPIPDEAIARSSGAYKNYYGY